MLVTGNQNFIVVLAQDPARFFQRIEPEPDFQRTLFSGKGKVLLRLFGLLL